MTAEWILLGFVIGFVPATLLAGIGMALLTEDGVVTPLIFPAGIAGGIVGAIAAGVLAVPFPFNGEAPQHEAASAQGNEHAAPVAGGDGQQLFLALPCKACHTIESLKSQGANGAVGPELTHIGAVAATRKPGMDAAAYIRESLLNPGAFVVSGFPNAMPKLVEPGADMDKLVAFLLSQK